MTDCNRLSQRQLDSFWDKVDRSGECWLWTAACSGSGYGRLRVRGNASVYAHRVAYELSGGTIPHGHDVDHICRRRECVRPSHLRIATRSQNNENFGHAHSHGVSGVRGVSWHSKSRRWRVSVVKNRHQYHGGFFADITEAERAAVALRNFTYTHNQIDRERKSA